MLVACWILCDNCAQAQYVWKRDSRSPVLLGGAAGLENYEFFCPFVLFNTDSSRYERWFSNFGRPPGSSGLPSPRMAPAGYPSPVLSPDPGSWDHKFLLGRASFEKTSNTRCGTRPLLPRPGPLPSAMPRRPTEGSFQWRAGVPIVEGTSQDGRAFHIAPPLGETNSWNNTLRSTLGSCIRALTNKRARAVHRWSHPRAASARDAPEQGLDGFNEGEETVSHSACSRA